VDSGLGFAGVHAWFETTAELMRRAGFDNRLINATEGGVRIAGYEELTLARVLAELPALQVTAASIAERAHREGRHVSPERIRSWLSVHAESARKVRVLARRVRRIAAHAAHATERGLPRAVTQAYRRLDQAEAELKQAIPGCPLVDAWSYREVEDALVRDGDSRKPSVRDARDAARQAIVSGGRVARAVETSASELHDALVLAAERIALAAQTSTTEK
jgi:hypothetical protein